MTKQEKLLRLIAVIQDLDLDDNLVVLLADKTILKRYELQPGREFCIELEVQAEICLDDLENDNIKFK